MFGLEFAGEIPFDDVYVHSIIQAPDGRRMSKSLGTGIDPLDLIDGGPRPPVFSEGGDFPAYGADAVRYGLLAMSSTQDVRFNEYQDRARAASSPTSSSTRPGSCCCACPRASTVPASAPEPQTVEDRWILSRLQAAEQRADARRSTRSSSTAPTPAALRLHLRRAVRLVPGDAQAAPVRRGQRRGARVRALRARADAGDRAPGDPVRDRGDLVLPPGRRRPADGAPLAAAPTTRCATSSVEARGRRARSRRPSGCAAGATRSARRPARRSRRGWRPRATSACSSTSPGSRGFEFSENGGEPVATVGVPGGTRRGAAVERRRPRGRAAAARPSAPSCCARRSRAPRASSPTRASSPRRRRPSCRPSARSSTG